MLPNIKFVYFNSLNWISATFKEILLIRLLTLILFILLLRLLYLLLCLTMQNLKPVCVMVIGPLLFIAFYQFMYHL